jgi:hypothetical protein
MTGWAVRLLGLALALAATPAFAGPYGGAAGRCPGALTGKVQRCTVKAEDNSTRTECLRFTGPGGVSGKFEMVSDLLGMTIGCTCKPGGTPDKPSFGGTVEFVCTGIAGVTFDGRIAGDGSLPSATVVNDRGATFVLGCQIDPGCVAQ